MDRQLSSSGAGLARLRISYSGIGTPAARLIVNGLEIGRTINAPDWILDACFTYGASSSEAQACLVTAHNALLVLHFGLSKYTLRGRTDLIRRYPDIYRFSASEDPLLYSARVRSLQSGYFRIVAGTAFGNILFWSIRLHQNVCYIMNVEEVRAGHTGAIFGVDQFEEWLASCSDDRGVRLGMFDVNAPMQADNGSNSLVEKWTHTSRVWGVKFIRIATDVLGLVSTGEDAFCKIQQIRREGLIQRVNDHYHSGKNIWSVADGQLGEYQVVTGGADGAIVSRDVLPRLSSGGAATHEAVQTLPKAAGSRFDHFRSKFTPLFSSLQILAVTRKGSNAKPPSIKQYLFILDSCLLALTDSGFLLRITKDESTSTGKNRNHEDGEFTAAYDLAISSKWAIKRQSKIPFRERPVLSNSEDHLVFVGNGNGNLFVCFPEDDETARFVTKVDIPISWLAIAGVRHVCGSHRLCCIVVYCNQRKAAKVLSVLLPMGTEEMVVVNSSEEPAQQPTGRFRNSPDDQIHTEVKDLHLSKGFEPTSARVLSYSLALVLGSRQSAIAIYGPLADSKDPYRFPLYHMPLHVPHVHEGDSVTSISGIFSPDDSPDCRQECFLTTGRNGTYAVHLLSLEGSKITSKILDISTTPFRSGIEGSYCAIAQEPISRSSKRYPWAPFWIGQWLLEGSGRVKCGDLILYGFDSKKFVVWNESHRSVVFSVDCENAHRPWAYNTHALTTEQVNLSFPHHGPFAWTQAGSLNIITIDQPDHSIIQQGGHGREIKALSVSPLPYQDLRHDIRSGRLIVTGAEDTTIRFFAVGPNMEAHARNKLILIRSEKKHNTGIQHLSFSSCGRYLFSSGGCEELYAWRISHNVPGVNLGVVLDCTFPKEADMSDLRITDFKVQDHGPGTFFVSAIYSNSMIKFFRFRPTTTDPTKRCELLHRFFYMDNCLTQINDYSETGTLTASTDGHLAFWPTSGGRLPHRKPVHQNSILAMHTIDLPSRVAGAHERLVVTGGDDNTIGLTLVRTSISKTFDEPISRTLRIEKAHAAAVTAICLLSITVKGILQDRANIQSSVCIRFLSAGNDQRVKLWSATVRLNELGNTWEEIGGEAMAAVDVDLVASTGTNVADVGAMELVSELEKEGEFLWHNGRPRVYVPKPLEREGSSMARVLVVGVGMEILTFAVER
jgi:WD40 repeat protein